MKPDDSPEARRKKARRRLLDGAPLSAVAEALGCDTAWIWTADPRETLDALRERLAAQRDRGGASFVGVSVPQQAEPSRSRKTLTFT